MPSELTYYLVWYALSRIALLVVIHRLLVKNAKAGRWGLGEDWPLAGLGFVPILAEGCSVVLIVAVVLSAALGMILDEIGDFYFNRYGVRRE